MTARASSMGFLTCVTPQTAPAFSVVPSMIEASSSLRPSNVNTAPCPALNKGLSSSEHDGARHRIKLVPPLSSTAKPALERCGEATRGTAAS